MRASILTLLVIFQIPLLASGQSLSITDPYLVIEARAGDPLYTTYTAAMERSRLYGDKGYKMNYYEHCSPLSYGSDQGGRFFTIWEINSVVVDRMEEFHKPPVVISSFPDMVLLEYSPWPGLEVIETFFVYSSSIALVDMEIRNVSKDTLEINAYPVFMGADSLTIIRYDSLAGGYILNHYETKKRLISNLGASYPYPTRLRDVFACNFNVYSYGGYSGDMKDFYNYIKTDFYSDNRSDSLNCLAEGTVDFVALQAKFTLQPGENKSLRYFRGIQDRSEDLPDLIRGIARLKNKDLQHYLDADLSLFSHIPRPELSGEEKTIYLSAYNLARGCMLPPTGKTNYNFYVFSREPLWGWGHGHQVLHESLSMLAYVYLDPVSVENSQRVYMEQQGEDGLIAYRHGPRGPQTYPHKGMPTTSSPFYSWINWEIYEVSHDTEFLEEAYQSGARYMEWLLKNRDADRDGTLEWGPYGIIENVRDWYNAVFQVSAERYLDVDKEDISDELECLDLSLMAVNEMQSLSEMANELGMKKEENYWNRKAAKMSDLINKRMWDSESGFYYHVNRKDHSFEFMGRDLKRQEIIGFLPLWAGVATPERAEKLVEVLTDTNKFWRKYGVPTLSADDPWYSPYVDYCCKWNGPVWLLWDYLVFDGLARYGYDELALELADKMTAAVTLQLSKNHNFWESYSPDNEVLNCPSNYIWDAIMAKLFIERNKIRRNISNR